MRKPKHPRAEHSRSGGWVDTSGARVRVLPPMLFAAPISVAALLRRRSPSPPAEGPRWVVAVVVALSGAAMMGWAFAVLRKHHTTVVPWAHVHELVTHGPFRWVRNPIYVGDVLVYLGACLWLRTWWPALALPGVLTALRRWVIQPEEQYLRSRFPQEYEAYAAQVPALVPRRRRP